MRAMHLAHQAEHALDLSEDGHGANLAVNVCDAAVGDSAAMTDTGAVDGRASSSSFSFAVANTIPSISSCNFWLPFNSRKVLCAF